MASGAYGSRSMNRITSSDRPRAGDDTGDDTGIEAWQEDRGPYRIRFARTQADREAAQRLRFEVFAGELGATLAGRERALDIDPLDEWIDHLLVVERKTGHCVGTYRLATFEQVGTKPGFYSRGLFDLDALDPRVGHEGVELGRACVAAGHRTRGVFGLLLRGIGRYLVLARKRYLFGCGSVPLEDVSQVEWTRRAVAAQDWIDPSLCVKPRAAHAPAAFVSGIPETEEILAPPKIPSLLSAYCAIGARLAPDPAWDPDFRTLDFFVLLDLERVEPRTYARYCQPR